MNGVLVLMAHTFKMTLSSIFVYFFGSEARVITSMAFMKAVPAPVEVVIAVKIVCGPYGSSNIGRYYRW